MIVEYKIPFSNRRKVARAYCKTIRTIVTPFKKRKFLSELNGESITYTDIPVIINNYNRLACLKKLIAWLEKSRMSNIYIIDNASSYPPLLDYYNKTKYTVIRLSANIGYKALWDTSIHLWFKGLPYIYTDPDILPIEACPINAVAYFQKLLNQYEHINKVGFGLKIDDIPEYYPRKKEVIAWETKFWKNQIAPDIYKADIDTTFALYRANSVNQQWGKTIRTGGKYLARHLPWYEDPNLILDEEVYYKKMTMGTSWYTAS